MDQLAYSPIFDLDEPTISTTRKLHIRRLNDILHLSLERGDLARARRAWAILARCKEFGWETKWKTSLLLLSDSKSSPSNERDVEFLKRVMRFHPDKQGSILQEIILRLASQGKYKDAREQLEIYLPLFPYQENPALHSYAGLMSLKLSNSNPSEDNTSSHTDINNLKEAQKYFKAALSIDPDNSVSQTFLEEVNKQLSRANTVTLALPEEALSDEEMELDANEPPIRGKRIRRLGGNE